MHPNNINRKDEAQREAIKNAPDLLDLRRIERDVKAIEVWNGVLPVYTLGNAMPFINVGGN